MPTATVTSKGQVTIPVEVRERLGIEAGTRVEFVPRSDGTWEFVAAGESVASIRGMFRSTRSASNADLGDAIAEAAVERYLG
ncbi:antitoxin PrlF [Microbacteriaceae bacterium SG_E_30_P1]|uniref:Antitoxin PrlF n=1 Tax=Antiquaquibacter oligotrophicus TaxID=2880260 RepID=A0ABT6KJB5_9MICO|nr:AbrB/MazE/SpoVT family DNA-binding domain-containing protein [Antiquaquibacter oligotrophicus]MDH6180078.1 antitoxin PrlF [Antiquaquibacter oligotrophicus]UDF14171.1 AbrB/MazE/SpoVT family DNA-binding domain-containing protein [Antiquaquibacter oligotrophicus]